MKFQTMRFFVFVYAFALLAFVCSVVSGDPVVGPHVVLAGDSITVGDPTVGAVGVSGYSDEFATLFSGQTTTVGMGGLDSSGYFEQVDPSDGTRTYAEAAAAANPEVIVFMLGINDAMRTNFVESDYDSFRKRVGGDSRFLDENGVEQNFGIRPNIFSVFETASNLEHVIVLSILPVDANDGADGNGVTTNERVDGTSSTSELDVAFGYNPWLQSEVARRNSDGTGTATFHYVDLMTGAGSGFELMADGVHLTAASQSWLADQAVASVNSVTAVPEPSQFAAFGVIAFLSFVCYRRKQ